MTGLRDVAAALACAALLAGGVTAQPSNDPEPSSRPPKVDGNRSGMRQLTAEAPAAQRIRATLEAARVSVELDQTPVRDALAELRRQIGVPLIARYDDDRLGYGIDADDLVTLRADDAPAITVLEAMLEQCAAGGDACTWQIRMGFVEVGTKARLSVPAACDRRIYYVADLLAEIPKDNMSDPARRELVALRVIESVVTTLEPEAWDYGQIDYGEEPDVEDDGAMRYTRGGSPPPPPPANAGAAPPAGDAPPRRYVPPRKIAILRYSRDVFIVDAPPYIHRELASFLDAMPKQFGGEDAPTRSLPGSP